MSLCLSLSLSLFVRFCLSLSLSLYLILSWILSFILISSSVQCSTEWHWGTWYRRQAVTHELAVHVHLPWPWGPVFPGSTVRNPATNMRRFACLWSSTPVQFIRPAFVLVHWASQKHLLFWVQQVLSALLSCDTALNPHFSVWSATNASQVERKGPSEIDFFLDTMVLFNWMRSSCG